MPFGLGFGPKRASEFAMSVFCNFWCVASVTRPRGSRGRVIQSFPCHAIASVTRPRQCLFALACGRVAHAIAWLPVSSKTLFCAFLTFCMFPFYPLSHSCLRRSETTQHTNHGIEWK
ncbi:uncharacterized protein DS421_14g466710 [Arachis hypogaea]|nr:uncharacterized protein DS421_14g466710 [Arachis hypogaea]